MLLQRKPMPEVATGSNGRIIGPQDIRLDDSVSRFMLGDCSIHFDDLYRVKVNYDPVQGDDYGGMMVLTTAHQDIDVGGFSVTHRVTFSEHAYNQVRSLVSAIQQHPRSQSGKIDIKEFNLPHRDFSAYFADV